MTDRTRWAIATAALFAAVALVVWLLTTRPPSMHWLFRLYEDKHFLKETVRSWGWMAPLGVVYSTIGLTVGTLVCFWVGHRWGEPLIRSWLSEHNWNRMNFILEAEGAIICFILYLIPGFPKDIISYLFGISPMPFWVFAVVSTAGRLPGTVLSSYFGAHVAEQQYIYAIAFMAIVIALCLPLYYYRDRIVKRFHRTGSTKREAGKKA